MQLRYRLLPDRCQGGFSLIELLIALAIAAVLVSVAIANYVDYTQRARVSAGLELAKGVKLAVSEYYSRSGNLPASNAEADLAPATEYGSDMVKSIGIASSPTTGTVVVVYNGRGSIADGDSLLLELSSASGSVKWRCYSNTLITNLLPTNCR